MDFSLLLGTGLGSVYVSTHVCNPLLCSHSVSEGIKQLKEFLEIDFHISGMTFCWECNHFHKTLVPSPFLFSFDDLIWTLICRELDSRRVILDNLELNSGADNNAMLYQSIR